MTALLITSVVMLSACGGRHDVTINTPSEEVFGRVNNFVVRDGDTILTGVSQVRNGTRITISWDEDGLMFANAFLYINNSRRVGFDNGGEVRVNQDMNIEVRIFADNWQLSGWITSIILALPSPEDVQLSHMSTIREVEELLNGLSSSQRAYVHANTQNRFGNILTALTNHIEAPGFIAQVKQLVLALNPNGNTPAEIGDARTARDALFALTPQAISTLDEATHNELISIVNAAIQRVITILIAPAQDMIEYLRSLYLNVNVDVGGIDHLLIAVSGLIFNEETTGTIRVFESTFAPSNNNGVVRHDYFEFFGNAWGMNLLQSFIVENDPIQINAITYEEEYDLDELLAELHRHGFAVRVQDVTRRRDVIVVNVSGEFNQNPMNLEFRIYESQGMRWLSRQYEQFDEAVRNIAIRGTGEEVEIFHDFFYYAGLWPTMRNMPQRVRRIVTLGINPSNYIEYLALRVGYLFPTADNNIGLGWTNREYLANTFAPQAIVIRECFVFENEYGELRGMYAVQFVWRAVYGQGARVFYGRSNAGGRTGGRILTIENSNFAISIEHEAPITQTRREGLYDFQYFMLYTNGIWSVRSDMMMKGYLRLQFSYLWRYRAEHPNPDFVAFINFLKAHPDFSDTVGERQRSGAHYLYVEGVIDEFVELVIWEYRRMEFSVYGNTVMLSQPQQAVQTSTWTPLRNVDAGAWEWTLSTPLTMIHFINGYVDVVIDYESDFGTLAVHTGGLFGIRYFVVYGEEYMPHFSPTIWGGGDFYGFFVWCADSVGFADCGNEDCTHCGYLYSIRDEHADIEFFKGLLVQALLADQYAPTYAEARVLAGRMIEFYRSFGFSVDHSWSDGGSLEGAYISAHGDYALFGVHEYYLEEIFTEHVRGGFFTINSDIWREQSLIHNQRVVSRFSDYHAIWTMYSLHEHHQESLIFLRRIRGQLNYAPVFRSSHYRIEQHMADGEYNFWYILVHTPGELHRNPFVNDPEHSQYYVEGIFMMDIEDFIEHLFDAAMTAWEEYRINGNQDARFGPLVEFMMQHGLLTYEQAIRRFAETWASSYADVQYIVSGRYMGAFSETYGMIWNYHTVEQEVAFEGFYIYSLYAFNVWQDLRAAGLIHHWNTVAFYTVGQFYFQRIFGATVQHQEGVSVSEWGFAYEVMYARNFHLDCDYCENSPCRCCDVDEDADICMCPVNIIGVSIRGDGYAVGHNPYYGGFTLDRLATHATFSVNIWAEGIWPPNLTPNLVEHSILWTITGDAATYEVINNGRNIVISRIQGEYGRVYVTVTITLAGETFIATIWVDITDDCPCASCWRYGCTCEMDGLCGCEQCQCESDVILCNCSGEVCDEHGCNCGEMFGVCDADNCQCEGGTGGCRACSCENECNCVNGNCHTFCTCTLANSPITKPDPSCC